MKQLTLITFLTALALTAGAQNRDTTFIKRPYYLGFTSGYSQYTSYAREGTPFDPVNPPNSNEFYREYYNERSIGAELAFPFLRKWECEVTFEYSRTKAWQQINYYHVVPQSDPQIGWSSAVSRNEQLNTFRLRSFFSYELLRKSKFAVNAGGGGWYFTSAQVGAEGGVKCYYFVNSKMALQFGVTAGYAKNLGVYGAGRISILLSGTRTYRAHPHKYYVRTYEEGE